MSNNRQRFPDPVRLHSRAGYYVYAGPDAVRLGASWRAFLRGRTWSHFVTLTTNEPSRTSKSSTPTFDTVLASERFMADRLHNFDARVNRALIGPKWAQRPQQRIEAICILEKPASNPHWHLVVNVRSGCSKGELADVVRKAWGDLVPAGSTKVQSICDMGALSNYILKTKPFMDGAHRIFFLPSRPASNTRK